MSADEYVEIGESGWKALPTSYSHAAHVMVYSTWPGRFMDKYDHKFAVAMQLRYDGTLGFPGGMVESGETPETAAGRELVEETGCSDPELEVTASDHLVTHVSQKTQLCLHFFAKQVSLEKLHSIESSMTTSSSWGDEVLGVVRVPLYTLPNGLGLPAFLRHQFIGTSRLQLLAGLETLMAKEELEKAVKLADGGHINTFVTQDEIKNY